MLAVALNPPSSRVASPESIVPSLQTAEVVRAVLISIRSLVSISLKPTVPLALKSWAEASASSVKPISAILSMVGASLVPLMVMMTVSVAVAPFPSVAVMV